MTWQVIPGVGATATTPATISGAAPRPLPALGRCPLAPSPRPPSRSPAPTQPFDEADHTGASPARGCNVHEPDRKPNELAGRDAHGESAPGLNPSTAGSMVPQLPATICVSATRKSSLIWGPRCTFSQVLQTYSRRQTKTGLCPGQALPTNATIFSRRVRQ